MSAKVGDYVLALVAQSNKNLPRQTRRENKHFLVAYLFKVTEVVPMERYEAWCKVHSPEKICTEDFFEGDCQYGENLAWRPGPHGPEHKNRNTGGRNSIISTEYAAWKSKHPHVLTDEEIAGLGLTREIIRKIGIGQKYIDFPHTDVADTLINSWKEEQRGGKRNKSSTRKKNRKN